LSRQNDGAHQKNMGKIRFLSPPLINQIAAGEVVERPASVVKELVENALDADAKSVIVDVRRGGIDFIRVTDDGYGMSPEDARLSVQRYATSKIVSADDLFNIVTLGFRGEALSAIPEVSDFEIQTRVLEAETGFAYKKEENVWSEREIAISRGTQVTVSRLFYNVPARRKFLKTPFTEYTHILNIMLDCALVHPEVTFQLSHNDSFQFRFESTPDWSKRIADILGNMNASHLLPLEKSEDGMFLKGFISKSERAVMDRKRQFVFVNRRPVRDALILKAVADGYRGKIPPGRFPIIVLQLGVEPHSVDVNVHPRKSEVKFVDANAVYEFVFQSISSTLHENSAVLILTNGEEGIPLNHQPDVSSRSSNGEEGARREASLANGENFASRPMVSVSSFRQGARLFHGEKITTQQAREGIALYREVFAAQHFRENKGEDMNVTPWKLLGQVAGKYIVACQNERICVFDQHAASEGVLFEKLKTDVNEEKPKMQQLIVPLTVEFSMNTFPMIFSALPLLSDSGFSIEEFGKNTLLVRGVPTVLANADISALLLSVAYDFLEDVGSKKSISLEEKRLSILRSAACHGAVRFSEMLQPLEQEQMLREVAERQVTTCAHGRPILWEISFQDLDKKFMRC
jgi:DNA mismatch repair protein MutL